MKQHRESRRQNKPRSEFDSSIVDLARVTRVTRGGKQLRFRACVAIGNKKGKVGVGVSKGKDVSMAVEKATRRAKRDSIQIPLNSGTIPHDIYIKAGAAKILMKPAKAGRGVIAGGTVRILCELAGIQNIVAKILGTQNKVNNAKAVIKGFGSFKQQVVVNRL